MAQTVYRNRYPGECSVTGAMVPKGGGWVVAGKNSTWEVICDMVANDRGYRKVDSASSQDGTPLPGKPKGAKLGLSVSDTWARVFEENESRSDKFAETGKESDKPLTDEMIGEFMMREFPGSTPESRSVARVRMYRGSYNAGKHSFARRKPPERPSQEYGPDGRPVAARRQASAPGVDESRVRAIAREEAGQAVEPLRARLQAIEGRPVVHMHFSPKKVKKVESLGKHAKFVDVLKRVEARVPVLLVGPAGCGKTHLASQVAEALDLDFSFNSMSEGVSESHLLGRMLPDAKGVWAYQPSPFVKAYRDGGVHLLDEVDAAEPNLLVTINAALANGFLSLPFAQVEPIRRHADSIIVAAANTYGNGADRQYVGRNQLDAATVDRFKMGTVEMDYDRSVEEAIAKSILEGSPDEAQALLAWAWQVRGKVEAAKLRRILSTRNVMDAAKLLAVGLKMDDVRQAYFAGWTDDEKNRVRTT